MYEYRGDERLKVNTEGSTRLTYFGLCGGLEHFKLIRFIVCYETIKRELNKRLIYECRCDERLNVLLWNSETDFCFYSFLVQHSAGVVAENVVEEKEKFSPRTPSE